LDAQSQLTQILAKYNSNHLFDRRLELEFMPFSPPIAQPTAVCKICGQTALLEGVVDFNKNCEQFENRFPLPLCGIPVYYHRCPACGFLFTTAFDNFSNDDFKKWIYNDEYVLVDPEYKSERPRRMTESLLNLLPNHKSIRILDYGAGNGQLAANLRAAGFENVSCYDPFVPEFSRRPDDLFDCILCFEVIEHSTEPRRIMSDIASFLKQPGIVVFTTLYSKPGEMSPLVNWWYVAPRNGHVSIHSELSMKSLLQSLGYQTGSFNHAVHVMVRELPEFAEPWLKG
jgi:SAM-dependent methyltransferase